MYKSYNYYFYYFLFLLKIVKKNPVSGSEGGSVSLTGSESVIISIDPDPSRRKKRKTLISTVFETTNELLSLKADVYVPTVISKKS